MSPAPYRLHHLIILSLLLLLPVFVLAQNTSESNGDWDEVDWSQGIPRPGDNVLIVDQVLIPKDSVVEIHDLEIGKDGHLTVNGTLKVNGNLLMTHNNSQFSMGSSARVIIDGNFDASNQVTLHVSSYLIIQGNFTKDGSSNQGDLNVQGGNIYIFGEVDDNWTNFESCGNYEGDTGAIEGETCDYGTEGDYINNQDNIPDDLKELISCFEITKLEDISVCENENLNLYVDPIANVTYQWQSKTTDGVWNNIGENTNIYTTSTFSSGNSYRLIVRPTEANEGNCKISISNVATVSVKPVDFYLGTISGNTEICRDGSNYTYSVPEVESEVTYEWTLPEGWTIENGQETRSITLNPGLQSGEIRVTAFNTCGTSHESFLWVDVGVPGTWTGNTDQNWNTTTNWECEKIPDSTTDVKIAADADHFPVINENETGFSRSISIDSGAEVTVNGSLEIHESIVSPQAINAISGTIVITGNTSQSIPAETFLDNRVKNIFINNAGVVNSQGDLEVTGILRVESGIFQTGDQLTLISNAEQTALIDGSGNGEIEGVVKMQRFLDPAFGYKYFSSPFEASVVGDFADYVNLDSEFPNFYRYNENRHIEIEGVNTYATGWETYVDPLSALDVMRGYALNFAGYTEPLTVEISGTVNNASYSLSLENNNREYTKGFHLIGNPYPSPIDWNAAAGWTKENIDDAIYFFTASEDNRYTGTYRSFVPNGVTSDGANTSSIIPSMQGFFIHVSDSNNGDYPVNGKLGLSNEVRVNDFNQSFYKSAEKNIPLIRLSAGYRNENISDPTVIYFDHFAKTSFDKDLDAYKLMNTDSRVPNFYSITPGIQELSINALAIPSSTKEIRLPLGIHTEKSGALEIKLQVMEHLPSGVNAYLVDLEERIVQNLERKSVYPFHLRKGEHNSRFELFISRSPLTDEAVAFKDPFSVRLTDDKIFVNLNLDPAQQGIVRASTMSGQLLETKGGSGKDILEFKGVDSSGVYIFTLETGNDTYSRKVLVRK